MKIKALCSFFGETSMNVGEVRDVPDAMAKELIGAGYAAEAAPSVGGKAAAGSNVESVEPKKAAPKKRTKKTTE